MSYGLQIQGDDGYNQIDEKYANLAFVGKATVTCTGNFNSYTQTTFYGGYATVTSLAGSFNKPFVFINPGNTYAIVESVVVNSDGTLGVGIASVGNDTFTIFVFDTPLSDSNPYGLQIFDANGNMTFSSNYRPMRIANVVQSQNSSLLSVYNGMNVGLATGTYAFCNDYYKTDSKMGQNGSTTFTIRYSEMAKITNTNISSSYGPVDWIPASSRTSQATGPHYMIVKVDGL